jgi:hypothetical protein
LVSRQSFPHLWKKLWKIDQNRSSEPVSGQKPHVFSDGRLSAMNLWDEILGRIETKVNRHSFYTWFRPTTFVSDDRSSLTVRVPNALFKDWLTKHYAGVISEATAELKRPNLLVHFVSDIQSDAAVIPAGREISRAPRSASTRRIRSAD